MTLVQASYGNVPAMPMTVHEPASEISPSVLFTNVLRRKWVVIFTTLLMCLPAALYVLTLSSYYDANALVMIDTKRLAVGDAQSSSAATGGVGDAIAISTQVDIMRSPAMAETVVDRLDLMDVPEFEHALNNRRSLLVMAQTAVSRLMGAAQPVSESLTAAQRRQLTAALLSRKVTITNGGKSYLIEIRARSGNPDLSASIANTFADAYLDFNRQMKIDAVRRANGLLDEQIAPLKDRVEKAETAVQQFRQQKGLVASHVSNMRFGLEAGSTVADEQLNEVDTQLILASSDVAQKQASLRALQSALKAGSVDAIPQVVTSPLIQALRQQEAELSSKEASLAETTLGDNPEMMAARAGSMRVRDRITAEIGKIAASLTSELATAEARQKTLQQRLNELQGQVATQSEADVSLVQLESEAQAARAVYQDYLSRFEQTSTQEALQEPEAELVSPAQTPVGKSGPAIAQLLVLITLGAAILGCGLALLMERGKSGMRTATQLQAATGLYALGFVPKAKGGLRRLLGSDRRSVYMEAISLVNNLLRFGEARYRARVVLVTSADSQEGKTFLAASLAAGVGHDGGRALLIDCDVRRPSVAKALKLEAASVTTSNAGANESTHLWQNVLPGLDVVTLTASMVQKPTLNSMQVQGLIEDARGKYDLVVLDAPPVLGFADAPLLSLCVDGTILAVRWSRTSSRSVSDAVKTLNAYSARVLGAVITQVNTSSLTDADGSHAQVYRNYSSYFA